MVQWVLTDRVDLSKDAQRQQVGAPEALMLPGDNEAHRWEITVLNNGEAADLTGASVAGYFLRSDGETVAVVGSVTGNVISVVLAQECYALEGLMRAIVRVTLNGVITTVIQRLFRVQQDIGDQIIDPGEVIPDIDELLAAVAAMEAATAAANAAAAAVPSMIAPIFSASMAYAAGDYVYYNGALYRFTADHAAGAWVGTDAEAAVIGDEISEVKSALQSDVFKATKTIASSDFNNYLTNGAYLVNSGNLANKPDTDEQGTLLVFAYNTSGNYGYDQIYITNSSWRMFFRAYVGGVWKEWKEVIRKNDLADFSETVFVQGSTASGNFNSYVSNGAYFVNSAMTNAPSGITTGLLCVFTHDKSSGYGTTQIFIPQNANYKPVYRHKWNSAWSDWSELYAGVSEVDSPANQNVLSPANFTLTGYISTADGTTFTSNSNYMCTNDFIDVPFGTESIFAVFPQTENNDRVCAFLYYDADGNYTGSYSGRLNGYNYKMATLSRAQFDVAKIKFWVNKTTVSGGSNDVCISFSTVQSFPQYEGVKKVSNNALETPEVYLPFVGKTIVNFGDSIFGNKRRPFSVSYALENLTGATVYNCGFGGTDMAARSNATWDAFSMYRLAYAIANDDFSLQDTAIEDTTAGLLSYFPSTLSLLKSIDFDNVDIITIAFGTNDFTGNIVLDNESDPDDTTKFCGALRYSLEQIMAAFPHIKIFVCGQTYRFWMDSSNVFIDDSDTHENGNGNKLTDFVAATKSVSDEYHVPFIDNYNIGINKINRSYYFPANDGTHQNYLGAKLIAEHIKHKLY